MMDGSSDKHLPRTREEKTVRTLPPAVESALAAVEAQFAVVLGQAERVRESCRLLHGLLADATGAAFRLPCRDRLLPLLRKRAGAIAVALAEHLRTAEGPQDDPRPLLLAMLEAREPDVRSRALEQARPLAESGRLRLDEELAGALGALLDDAAVPAPTPQTYEAIEAIVRGAAGPEGIAGAAPAGGAPGVDLLEAALAPDQPPPLRRLAARLLDRGARPAPAGRWPRLLGEAGAALLAPYLQYTRATDSDLVDLTLDPAAYPAFLQSVQEAERILGTDLLGSVIAELGWSRLAFGLHCRRWDGFSVEGGLPLVVSPLEGGWLADLGSTRRVWDRFLIVAHGGRSTAAAEGDEEDAVIQRFRRYNVRHAELLGLILEVAPLTPVKVQEILTRMDDVVEDFALLFSAHTEDARRVGDRYAQLRDEVRRSLAGAPKQEPLGSDLTRRVQMFEDPRNLDEVRTVHGLKRYLHQQGLRLAFRAFRTGRSTNRTVDLLVAAPHRVLQVLRKVRYLDFEPDPAASPTQLPFAVTLVVEALGRRLLLEKSEAPDVELLLYGNEVQAFVRFRNHPVFVRLDLSPPQRGGMIDLEYFGVSQYELDRHPDLSLPWIRRMFQRLDFDVQADDYRLHVRYDKERALDLGDLTTHARRLCALLPHLMEIDWVIGTLPYGAEARAQIADAWADRLVQWGWLPIAEALTSDRTRILSGIASDPAGNREIAWDGRGEYSDRFCAGDASPLWSRLLGALAVRDLDSHLRIDLAAGAPFAQLPLESSVLEPLRQAVARGDVRRIAGGRELLSTAPEPTGDDATTLARLLLEGGSGLEEAARLAFVVGSVERHARFVTVGSIQGHPVQRASLYLRAEEIELTVLRDADGIARLATARARPQSFGPVSGGIDAPREHRLDGTELIRRLRRDNYLGPGYEPPERETLAADLPALFAVPHPVPPPRQAAGEHVVTGTIASPGTAAGFARFAPERRSLAESAGAVLLAPAIRPEDTPWIRRCAAVVSTGGGILSHAGLIALEAQKPALVIAGRWRRDALDRTVLLYRFLDFEETIGQLGPYEVIDRRNLREREEVLREGDLLSVDADAGTLVVLGQDRDALALHEGLRHLGEAAEALRHAVESEDPLALRGRWLRAIHAVDRLLSRLDRPALARHAARELLRTGRLITSGSRREEVVALFRTLLANAACGEAARATFLDLHLNLRRRHEAATREATHALPAATTLAEVLELRLGVRRLERTLEAVTAALSQAGFAVDSPPASSEVETSARTRLRELRAANLEALDAAADDPGKEWRIRHLLAQSDGLHSALGTESAEPGATSVEKARRRLADHDAARRESLAGRPLLACADGGLELAPLIGAKGANLGEVARILGPSRVPPWFAVTDVVFQQFLQAPAGRGAAALGLTAAHGTLYEAITEVLSREDLDPARQSLAVRQLWQEAEFPAAISSEILAAYHALGGEDGAGELPSQPYVAIRSSGLEEDTEGTSGAGQFDTFLFIRGDEAVLHHVKLSLASLWTERAIHTRARQASPLHPGGGVLVQRIIDARAAGVLHTLSTASGQLREMIVNAGLGLGEGIVSGVVEVDHIVVSRDTRSPEDPLRFRYTVGDKTSRVVFDRTRGLGTRREETLYHQRLRPALEYVDLCELVRAAARCEEVYGYPLDLEFAFEEDRLSVLQARPIVTFQSALRETTERFPWSASGEGAREEGAA